MIRVNVSPALTDRLVVFFARKLIMPVSVSIPDELTRYSDGRKQIDVDAATIGELLQILFTDFPELRCRLVDSNGHFYPYIPAFLNGEKLPLQGSSNGRLQDGENLAFILVASGG